jgi:hypothetical protein
MKKSSSWELTATQLVNRLWKENIYFLASVVHPEVTLMLVFTPYLFRSVLIVPCILDPQAVHLRASDFYKIFIFYLKVVSFFDTFCMLRELG